MVLIKNILRHIPEQNRMIERFFRTIKEVCMAKLIQRSR